MAVGVVDGRDVRFADPVAAVASAASVDIVGIPSETGARVALGIDIRLARGVVALAVAGPSDDEVACGIHGDGGLVWSPAVVSLTRNSPVWPALTVFVVTWARLLPPVFTTSAGETHNGCWSMLPDEPMNSTKTSVTPLATTLTCWRQMAASALWMPATAAEALPVKEIGDVILSGVAGLLSSSHRRRNVPVNPSVKSIA